VEAEGCLLAPLKEDQREAASISMVQASKRKKAMKGSDKKTYVSRLL